MKPSPKLYICVTINVDYDHSNSLDLMILYIAIGTESYQVLGITSLDRGFKGKEKQNHNRLFKKYQNFVSPRREFTIFAQHSSLENKDFEEKKDIPVQNMEIESSLGLQSITKYLLPVIIIGLVAGFSLLSSHIDINQVLQSSVTKIEELGPYGYLYFAVVIHHKRLLDNLIFHFI